MTITCCVVGCNSEWNPVTTVTFHRITTDKKLLKLWLSVVDMKVSKYARICSLHFKPEDYKDCSSAIRLKPDAVPSFNILGNEVDISDDSFEDDEDNKDLSLLKKILMSNANRNNPAGEVDDDRDSSDDEQPEMLEAVITRNSSHSSPKAKSPEPKEMETIGIQVSRTTQGEIALRQQVKMLKMRLKRRDAKISYMKTVLNMIKKLVKGTDMEYKLSCELQNISKLSDKTGSNARKGSNTLAKPGSPVSDCDDVIMNDDEDFSPSEEDNGAFCEVTLSSNLKLQNSVKL